MSVETRTMPYIGNPTPAQVELLKAGKALLGVDFYVHADPVGLESEGTAIAFEHPKWCYLGGYAYVANSDTPEKFRNALAAIYGIRYAEYLTTPAQWLSRVLGAEVKEIVED